MNPQAPLSGSRPEGAAATESCLEPPQDPRSRLALPRPTGRRTSYRARTRERPDGVEGWRDMDKAIGGDAADRRAEPRNPAECGRNAHQTARVGAQRHVGHSAGDCNGRATARSTGHQMPGRQPRIARRSHGTVRSPAAEGQFHKMGAREQRMHPEPSRRSTALAVRAAGASAGHRAPTFARCPAILRMSFTARSTLARGHDRPTPVRGLRTFSSTSARSFLSSASTCTRFLSSVTGRSWRARTALPR